MTADARATALAEMAFCRRILAKGGATVVTETLKGVSVFSRLVHYPEGEVFDPDSGAQWFYHSHRDDGEGDEHGHFHCFLKPEGPDGTVHHLVAVGVDACGRLRRLFTVNQWVVADDWLDAAATIALLPRFDVHMPEPSYLVNRWLTAVLVAYEDEIADLLRERDSALAAHCLAAGAESVREDRSLEIVSIFTPILTED